jgi:hypothetical protein
MCLICSANKNRHLSLSLSNTGNLLRPAGGRGFHVGKTGCCNLSLPLRRKLIYLICSANKNRHLSLSPIHLQESEFHFLFRPSMMPWMSVGEDTPKMLRCVVFSSSFLLSFNNSNLSLSPSEGSSAGGRGFRVGKTGCPGPCRQDGLPRIPCRYVVFSSSLSFNNYNLSPPLRRKLISLICSANKNRHLSLSNTGISLSC